MNDSRAKQATETKGALKEYAKNIQHKPKMKEDVWLERHKRQLQTHHPDKSL